MMGECHHQGISPIVIIQLLLGWAGQGKQPHNNKCSQLCSARRGQPNQHGQPSQPSQPRVPRPCQGAQLFCSDANAYQSLLIFTGIY